MKEELRHHMDRVDNKMKWVMVTRGMFQWESVGSLCDIRYLRDPLVWHRVKEKCEGLEGVVKSKWLRAGGGQVLSSGAECEAE